MLQRKEFCYINAYVCIMHIGGSISASGKPLWGPTGYRLYANRPASDDDWGRPQYALKPVLLASLARR